MKTSIFLTSFLSTNCSGSNPLTSPAIRAENCVASNRVIGPIPVQPAQSAAQFACVPMPSGDTRPTPVTTTRLLNPPPLSYAFARQKGLTGAIAPPKGALGTREHATRHRCTPDRPAQSLRRAGPNYFFLLCDSMYSIASLT